jgi:CheY-like chemotaxis protein
LDLNLPRINGHEVLKEVKNDPRLKRIPVVVLTGSKSEEDISRAYDAHANCYVTKPADLDEYFSTIQSIGDFWFDFVKLPSTS